MKHRIPLNTLRAFEAVGRHCHVRRAAEELHLTHAALSRQVRILEDRLGTRLFTRNNNRMQLTGAGQRFLETVQNALQTLETGAINLDPASLSGELRIAATPTISISWLPGVLYGFIRRYPEIEVHVSTIEPHQRRLGNEPDVAICLGRPDPQGRNIRKLYQEYYLPVAAPSLVAPGIEINRPADLLDYTLLHERVRHWDVWLKRQGMDGAAASGNLYFDYGYQSIEAARRGLGIVLADQLEVATDLQQGTLVRLLGEEAMMPVDAGMYLLTRSAGRDSVRARLFVEMMCQHLESLGAVLTDDEK